MVGSLPLCCVNHISRVVSDVKASTAFYRDILGFQEIKRPSFDFDGSWLWSYSVGIHLIEGTPVQRSAVINPKTDHLSFQAENLEEVQQRLEELGIPYVKQTIVENGVQVQQVFFHDPDHNCIEICNCNCLPILPLKRCLSCNALSTHQAAADEEMHNNGQPCSSTCSQDSGDEDMTGFDPANAGLAQSH